MMLLQNRRTRGTAGLLLLLMLAGVAIAAVQYRLPFGPWQRVSHRPILEPSEASFESAGVFNPTVVKHDGKIVMLYRAQDKAGTSRIGYAESTDGIHFVRRSKPVLEPQAEYERDGGVEDPRLVEIGGVYYLTYTAYNKKNAQLAMATSTDLLEWKRQGILLPAYKGRWNVNWTKSGAILNQKVNGHYWMYFMADAKDRPGQMGVAYSDDLIHWTEALDHPVVPSRDGKFDSKVVEPGPAPVMTDEGILLIYNGADDGLVYRTAWVLFDKNNPAKAIARADQPIFEVGEDWERTGQVPNVVFVEGMIRQGKKWLFYYGGADRVIGVATANSR